MRASIILGVGISACLVLSACGNFVLKTATLGAGEEQNNVAFYNPTTRFKVVLNFATFVEDTKAVDSDGTSYVASRKYYVFLKPGADGVVFTGIKDFNKNQQLCLSLAQSEGAFTDVDKLEITLDAAGCLSLIDSDLTDKKKDVALNTVSFAFDVAKIAAGVPTPPSAPSLMGTGPQMVAKTDMNFSVSREFFEEEMRLIDGKWSIDLTDEVGKAAEPVFSKAKLEERPANLSFRVVFDGDRPRWITMNSTEMVNELSARVKPTSERTEFSLLRGRRQTGSDSAFRTTPQESDLVTAIATTENKIMDGIPYPLPRRVNVTIQRTVAGSPEDQATGKVTSVDGGGLEVLQIASKSFVKRTMVVTFSEVNGMPKKVAFTSDSQAEGASKALSELSASVQTKLAELEAAKEAKNPKKTATELAAQAELLTKLKASEKNIILLEAKIEGIEKEIETEQGKTPKDPAKIAELQKQLADQRLELKYARLERSLLNSGLEN